MTDFLLFLCHVLVVMVAVPVTVFCSVKLGVVAYHLGTRQAVEFLKRVEKGNAR